MFHFYIGIFLRSEIKEKSQITRWWQNKDLKAEKWFVVSIIGIMKV